MDKTITIETNQSITIMHNGHAVASIQVEPGRKGGPYENDFNIIFDPIDLEPKDMPGRYYTITKASHPNWYEKTGYK